MARYANNKDGTLDLIAGAGDTSTLANKTDISSIILTGTTNSTGSTITSGTWFYLNGVLVKAKADIANGATFTENTNYEVKTVGDELSELNSKSSGTMTVISNEVVTLDTNVTCTFYLYNNGMKRFFMANGTAGNSNLVYNNKIPSEYLPINTYTCAIGMASSNNMPRSCLLARLDGQIAIYAGINSGTGFIADHFYL